MTVATTALKKKLLKVSAALAERYGSCHTPEVSDFIEALILQILSLGTPLADAERALERIHQEYVDWNDMRVATVREIQDILGPDCPRNREKAEDLHSLLADLYTAFRSMDLGDMIRTPEGIETIRALPDTTLVRADMVEWALMVVCGMETLPCNEEQFDLLAFLGGVPKNAALDDMRHDIIELLDREERLQLTHGLRSHNDFLEQQDIDGPKPISFGWEKAKPKPKSATKKSTSATSAKGTGQKRPAAKKSPAKTSTEKKSGPKKSRSTSTKSGSTTKKSGSGPDGTRKNPAVAKEVTKPPSTGGSRQRSSSATKKS